MASIGHVAVGMAAARFRGERGGSRGLVSSMLLWSGLAMLPDADVSGLALGVRYGAPWGHRGATHSFVFSIGLGVLVGAIATLARGPTLPFSSLLRCLPTRFGREGHGFSRVANQRARPIAALQSSNLESSRGPQITSSGASQRPQEKVASESRLSTASVDIGASLALPGARAIALRPRRSAASVRCGRAAASA